MELLQEKLQRLAKESEKELREIGLENKLKKNITYTINYRAKCRLGQCCSKKDINISSWLLEVGSDKDIKNTIIHELLHTFDDTIGHKAKWQYYARYVNNRTDYHITRTTSIDNIYARANVEREHRDIVYKWEIKCRQCGEIWKKTRITNKVLNSYKRNGRYHKSCGCHDLQVMNLENGEIIC